MKKSIYKFSFDCERQGELEGILISTKEKVKKLIESKIEVYFGEVLGKHSEVYGNIEESEITFVSDNEEAVRIIEEFKLTSGYDPFDYNSTEFELEGIDVTEKMTVGEIINKLLKLEK